MPRGTTPDPVHSGQVIPNWARIALRMKSLLLGRSLRNSASSSSTLNATILDLLVLRGMARSGTVGDTGILRTEPGPAQADYGNDPARSGGPTGPGCLAASGTVTSSSAPSS